MPLSLQVTYESLPQVDLCLLYNLVVYGLPLLLRTGSGFLQLKQHGANTHELIQRR